MSIGKRIRDTRISRGLTQEEVAKIVGVATQTIYKYEKEHISVLYSICEGNANYKAVTELYNREFLATRINMVTEFILANKEFLQKNMPGITEINSDTEE